MSKSTRSSIRSIIYEDPQGNIKTLDVTAPLGRLMAEAINKAIERLVAQGCRIVEIPKPTNGKNSKRKMKPPAPINRRRLF